MNTNDKCKNCGGDYGLHHYQTNQCPVGGREAPLNRKQEWKSTTFEADDSEQIARLTRERDEARELAITKAEQLIQAQAANAALTERVTALEAAARQCIFALADDENGRDELLTATENEAVVAARAALETDSESMAQSIARLDLAMEQAASIAASLAAERIDPGHAQEAAYYLRGER